MKNWTRKLQRIAPDDPPWANRPYIPSAQLAPEALSRRRKRARDAYALKKLRKTLRENSSLFIVRINEMFRQSARDRYNQLYTSDKQLSESSQELGEWFETLINAKKE